MILSRYFHASLAKPLDTMPRTTGPINLIAEAAQIRAFCRHGDAISHSSVHGESYRGLDALSAFRFFAHRARTARLALALRSSGVSFAAVALPPALAIFFRCGAVKAFARALPPLLVTD